MAEHSRRLERLLESIAEGESVDWQALEDEAGSDEALRNRIRDLRVIWGVGAAHRSLNADEGDGSTTVGAGVVPPEPAHGASLHEYGSWRHLQLVRKIGEGAFGEVYLARDPLLDHSVALKLLKSDVSDRSRLLHEARILAQIRHNNIVLVHGADVEGGRLGFWMEFVDGRTLSDVIEHEGLRSAGEAAVIGQDLCRALAAVHGKGIAHRDIKAGNVIRERGGRIVLMDFGAGRRLKRSLERGHLTGTPLYMAPELLRGGAATKQSDIYALGALLFHLVTGGYPVTGLSLDELGQAHEQGRRHRLADLRPELPPEFVRVVERMLSPYPADRYQTAATALAALETVALPSGPVLVDRPAGLTTSIASTTEGVSLVRILLGVVAVFAASLFSGYLTTTLYQSPLDLTGGFDASSAVSWPFWGFRALVAGGLVMAGVAMAWVILRTVCSGLLAAVPPVRRICQRVGSRVSPLGSRARALPEPTIASWILMVQVAVLALFLWRFQALIRGLDSFITHGPRAALSALAPGNRYDQILFDVYLNVQVLVFGATWVWLLRRGVAEARALVATGMAITALMFLTFKVVPFRILYHNEAERATYHDSRCYIVAKSGRQVRVFCPQSEGRTFVVSLDDPSLHEEGVTENIFSVFDAAP